MKILQIFGWVVAIHLVAFFCIFASPGCSSSPRNVPTPDATVPSASSSSSGVSYNAGLAEMPPPADRPLYIADNTPGRATPTRPGSPNAAAITPVVSTAEGVAPVTTYTIRKGDSLWLIAKKNHITVSELTKANNIGSSASLQPGKKLIIPGKPGAAPRDLAAAPAAAKPAGAEKPAAGHAGIDAVKHTVQPGESLGIIARKYQVTTGELAAANSITDPSKVRAGQQLIIPGFKAVGSKAAAPGPKPAAGAAAEKTAPAAGEKPPAPAAPHFEIAPPPPGQDLDSGLKEGGTEVPTIKVEAPKAEQPPKP